MVSSALCYIRAAGNCQQAIAGTRSAHTSVIDITVQLWETEASQEELLTHTAYRGHGEFLKITHSGRVRPPTYPLFLRSHNCLVRTVRLWKTRLG